MTSAIPVELLNLCRTAMINHIKIYDLSYIHWYSSPIYGYITNSQCDQFPVGFDSSVGRALHRYRRGNRFESRSGLNFFQALISQLLILYVLLCV